MSNHEQRKVSTHPNRDCGYEGLDHTRCFVNAFITCPYDDGQSVIDSVEKLRSQPAYAWLSAERLAVKFYSETAKPILVSASFPDALEPGQMIPKRVAVPLMMRRELADWEGSQRAETWEAMRYYFLGSPHGNRSSLFVNQETALAMKKIHAAMNETGMFGPLKSR